MKLPEQAKKVFDGEIFDVYQWDQEMYDGSTETFGNGGRRGINFSTFHEGRTSWQYQ